MTVRFASAVAGASAVAAALAYVALSEHRRSVAAGCRNGASRAGGVAVACAMLVSPIVSPVSAGAADRQVIVTTRIVMASNDGVAQLSGPGMENLTQSLKLFHYTSYRLLQQERRLVALEKMEEFPVPGGRSLLVQPTAFENGRVSLYVMLMHGRKALVNTVLKLRNRGEFVVAGPHHEDGVLFLAIGAWVPDAPSTAGEIPGLLPAAESK